MNTENFMLDVTPDDGGDVELTTDKLLQKVTEKNIKHINVIYDSDKNGSLCVRAYEKDIFDKIDIRRLGGGTGNVCLIGEVDGDVIKDGDGDGDAFCLTSAQGTASRLGAGNGNAFRIGMSYRGTGEAIKEGTGIGKAYPFKGWTLPLHFDKPK